MGLPQFGGFETANVSGTTYLSAFSAKQGQVTGPLFFYEYVTQRGELGPDKFLAAYADGLERWGYAASPLEVMAFILQSRFERDTDPYDVVDHVKRRVTELT